MSGPYLVGVDCGSQSAKVVIVDPAGAIVARGRRALRPTERPRHGVVVHPDDDLWDAIVDATRQAVASFTGDVAEIAAIGLCPIRCCKAFLRADGSLVEPVISWMDDRAYQPYVPADPSLAWCTTASGYLAHRMTGQMRDTAANNIALQWPIDTDTWNWSDDPAAFAALGVRRDQLPELQMPAEVIGPLTASAATALGLPAGIPVVETANDKAVEMLGAGTVSETTALVSLGTYIAAMVHGRENHRDPANFWTNFAAIPHRYLYESNGVRRGMWTLTWFLDLLGPEVADRAASLGMSREAYLEREAAAVPAGSDGLMTVLDWLATTDKPFRKGMMLGFDARHTRGHVYRSILEAIALTMKHHVDAMIGELRISLTDIVVTGGGASSALFMQIFADVFGLPAARTVGGRPAGRHDTGTTAHAGTTADAGDGGDGGGAGLGAAMCAAAAVGVHPDVETAVARMAPARQIFTPDPERGAVYRRMAGTVYHDIRQHTDPLFERAYPIFH